MKTTPRRAVVYVQRAADVATRFATALAVCDALLSVVTGDGEHDGDAAAQAVKVLPILLYVNELREPVLDSAHMPDRSADS